MVLHLRYTTFLIFLSWLLTPFGARAQVLQGTFAGGNRHSVALHADGTLWATGDNTQGQLGSGSTSARVTWQQVGTDATWKQLTTGGEHSLGLKADGTLWAWGSNSYGQLGLPLSAGTSQPVTAPVQVPGTWVQVAAGTSHTLALKADGTLWAWGLNNYGQLGFASTSSSTNFTATPTQVAGSYVQVASGAHHSLALTASGTLYTWGRNTAGQLGVITNNGTATATPTPTAVTGTYVIIAAGASHSLALTVTGTLYTWGSNQYGQLGTVVNAGTPTPTATPTQVAGVYTRLAGGGDHSLAIQADGSLYTWGRNDHGQLGAASSATAWVSTPARVPGVWVQVAAGDQHSLGLKADGTLWTWGLNQDGQLGRASSATTVTADLVPTRSTTALVTRCLVGTADTSLALKGDGTLWICGGNDYGQYGDGTTTNRLPLAQMGTDTDWIAVSAGDRHVLALKADGRLFAWGYNRYGQLGNTLNNQTDKANPTPYQVPGIWAKISAGTNYSIAQKADGSTYTWGINQGGQLGTTSNIGTRTPNPVPTKLPYVWKTVLASNGFTLALQATGKLWGWGYNTYGELGSDNLGSVYGKATPVQVDPATDWASFSVGDSYVLALKGTGTLWGWGANPYGQQASAVGINAYFVDSTPTQIPGVYLDAQACGATTLVLKPNGTIWTCGINYAGQLGQDTYTTASANPVLTQEVTKGTTWTKLGKTAGRTSLVRTASALSFASAGNNYSGQLGDGSTLPSWPRFDRLHMLTYSTPLAALPAAPNAAATLSLVPNPAVNQVQVLGAPVGAMLTLLDALGRPVLTTHATTIDVTSLPAGIYLVQAVLAGQSPQTSRLLVR
jgi:alpha-tubulin suppressor-like RCC1 family protein